MQTMNASEFKAKCLAVLDSVAASGEPVLILKRGRPVAQLYPAASTTAESPQSSLRGTVRTLGDIVEPAVPADHWNAEREELP